jgi:intraflagellar transport protein 122
VHQQGVFLPYAQWLAHNDRFDAALDAYRKAGRPDLSLQTTEQLIYNAVIKQQFKDAAYYYWLSGQEALKALKGGEQESWDKVTYMFMYLKFIVLRICTLCMSVCLQQQCIV